MIVRRRITPPGNPPGLWDERVRRARRTDLPGLVESLGLAADPRLLVVVAHPDDETLGAGRLIAAWSALGWPVGAVTMTAGEACVSQIGIDIPGIAERRRAEWAAALGRLGAVDRGVIGLPDGALVSAEDQVVTEIRRLVAETEPALIIGTAANDPHPDHATVGRAVRRVADELAVPSATFPIWMKYWMEPGDLTARDGEIVVECGETAERVREAAWAEYVSQSAPLREDLHEVVPAEMAALLSEQLLFVGAG